MAQYFTDFSEYNTGSPPTDWSTMEDSNTVSKIQTDSSATGGKVWYHDPGNSDDFILWDSISATDIEIVCRFKLTENQYLFGLVGRMNNEFGYSSQTDGFVAPAIRRWDNSDYTILGSGSIASVLGEFAWIRLRINGSTINSKYWFDTNSEPSNWQVTVTDSTYSGSGGAGIFQFRDRKCEIDIFGVGTDGSTAPTSSGGTTIPNAPTGLTLTEL
jgi:hypothetical protein